MDNRYNQYIQVSSKKNAIKVLLLGDSGVGKSSIIRRLIDGIFEPQSMVSSVGIDFREKTFIIDDSEITLRIWDTAGQERFKAIAQNFCRGVAGFIYVYAICDKHTFDRIEVWLNVSAQENYNIISIPKILVAAKSDMEEQRCITTEQGKQLAAKHDMKFIEASSLTGDNVEEIFIELAKDILAQSHSSTSIYDIKSDIVPINDDTYDTHDNHNNHNSQCCD